MTQFVETCGQGLVKNKYERATMSLWVEMLSKYIEELRGQRRLTVSSVIQRQYNADECQHIVNKLQALTGLSGWKTYNKNRLQILIEMDSPASAIKLAQTLNSFGVLKAQDKTIQATKKPVVLIENINLERLMAVNLPEDDVKSRQRMSIGAQS